MPLARLISLPVVLVAGCLAGLATGCGSEKEDTAPTACIATPSAYLQALEAAPGAVRLEGEVPISECLVPRQGGGNLASVGGPMVVAATRLNNEARSDPGGSAALQLGYLLGAASKGADSIHTDLMRRLNASAQFSE